MQFNYKVINSFDANEVALGRVFNFIKYFSAQILLVDCFSLSVRKQEPIIDKSTFNKNNWKHTTHLKPKTISVYNYSFNIKNVVDKNLSLFYKKYNDYSKSIQGKVYYQNGNIIRIIVSCYGEKNNLLAFIKYHPESHLMIERYYRLLLASMTDVHPNNKSISGRIECSYKIKPEKFELEYVLSDENISQKFIKVSPGLTSQGAAVSLSNLLAAFVGPRADCHNKFMIRFENDVFKSLTSKKLIELQKSFIDFPKLYELVRFDDFNDYIIVIEMQQI